MDIQVTRVLSGGRGTGRSEAPLKNVTLMYFVKQ
jgi:hypothetical protein